MLTGLMIDDRISFTPLRLRSSRREVRNLVAT
jgi:hypothetical protein